MTENNVLAGHAMAEYENGHITEEKVLALLEKYRDDDQAKGYMTPEIDEYIDSVKYS